jgi:Sec-independent protein translocase protein TatA
MEIFNVGILEFLFILLLAFLVLGPKKTVELAGEVGRWIKEFVKSPVWKEIIRTSNDIKDMPRKIMDDVEIQKTIDEIERSTRAVNEQLHQPVDELKNVGTILPPESEAAQGEPPDEQEQDLP